MIPLWCPGFAFALSIGRRDPLSAACFVLLAVEITCDRYGQVDLIVGIEVAS